MFSIPKEVLSQIETIFGQLIKNSKDSSLTNTLGEVLSEAFRKTIYVRIVPPLTKNELFIMRVLPEESVVDKITSAVLNNQGTSETIASIWKECNSFLVEIDGSILIGNFTERELTSLLLHELGHVAYTNSVPNRISSVMQYTLANADSKIRNTLASHMYRGLVRIPVVYACSFGNNNGLKKELKADRFAVRHGYMNDIMSSMRKVDTLCKNKLSNDKLTEDSTTFLIRSAEQLQGRQASLARKNILRFRNRLGAGYLRESVDLFLRECLSKEDTVLYEKVELIQEGAYDQLRKLLGKKMEPITKAQIDYIFAKLEGVTTVDDKLLLLSYTNSKLELVEYYIAILENPKTAKRYRVPHTMEQLRRLQVELEGLRKTIKEKRLVSTDNYIIYYPDNYAG